MPQSPDTDAPARPAVLRLVPLALLAAGLALALAFDVHKLLTFENLAANREALLVWRADNPVFAALAFTAAYAAAVAVSLPGAVWLTIFGGFLFGWVAGTVLVVIGASLGAMVLFLAVRYAFADVVRPRVAHRLPRLEAGFRDNAASYLLVLRLVPLFPFWLVNLAPALLGVSARLFAVTTVLGIIPGTAVYASLGNGLGRLIEAGKAPDLRTIFQPEVLGPLLALAALSLVPVLYKRIRRA